VPPGTVQLRKSREPSEGSLSTLGPLGALATKVGEGIMVRERETGDAEPSNRPDDINLRAVMPLSGDGD